MVAPDAKRKAVAHVVLVHGVSQRRACEVLAVDRSSVRHRSVRPDDAAERATMKAVAAERRRFGYRRIHIMPDRRGIVMNLKKLRRLYREEHLQVRKRGGRKRALGTRRPLAVPQAANDRWSLDFISEALTDRRRFRVLAVVDDFTRECLTLVVDTSLSGARVVQELDAVIARRGRPGTIVSDNGTEFTSTAILSWCQRTEIARHLIAPESPCKIVAGFLEPMAFACSISRASTAAFGTSS
jgi:putative transposase